MTRLRSALALGAVTLVAAAGAAAAAPPASTIGPDVVGWWSTTNRAPLPAVAPPDVGAKDLYVAGSNSLPSQLTDPTGAGPLAIAALQFRLPEGAAVTTLRLKLAGTKPPAVSLTACRATTSFTAAYDGPWADAPAYDCSEAGTARLDADGTVLVDGVDALRDGRDLSVVLVPGPLDRVVVAAPDASTLGISQGATSIGDAPGGGAPLPAAAGSAGSSGAGPSSGLAPVSSGALPGPASSGAAPAVASPAAAPAAPGAPGAQPAAAVARPPLPTRPWPALLATLLVAAAAFVPIVRPLGTLRPAAADRSRGVGRFRSERSGAVPDLV